MTWRLKFLLYACLRDRAAFGSALSEDSLVRHRVAQSRMEIAQVTYSLNSRARIRTFHRTRTRVFLWWRAAGVW